MPTSENLKRLIKDADAIKEASINQAKSMLAESVLPHLKQFVTTNIHEESDEDEMDNEKEESGDEVPETGNKEIPADNIPAEDNVENGDENQESSDEEDKEMEEESIFPLTEDDDEYEEDENDYELNDKDDVNDEEDHSEENFENEDIENIFEEDENDESDEDKSGEEDEKDEMDEDINKILEKYSNKPKNEVIGVSALKLENKNLKKKVKIYESLINRLHGDIKENHLLNTKLLYLFSLFNENYSFNGQDKIRIVEKIDQAKNGREAKLIYNGIKESINIAINNRSKKRPLVNESIKHIKNSIKETPKKTLRDSLVTEEKINTWNKILNESK